MPFPPTPCHSFNRWIDSFESIDPPNPLPHPSPHTPTNPHTAEEYLLRVRLESESLPEIAEAQGIDPSVWAGRQTAYMPAQVGDGMWMV